MGMAAGQARLLSITARLTDNENMGQSLSFAKQRLADETEQVNAKYNAALSATKLTVLTGFNGSVANYSDISYGLMTGYNTVGCGKQYVVANAKGETLVTKKLAEAFEAGNGDLNVFLEKLGYSISDIDVNAEDAGQKVHEAWDKYLKSVGKSFEDEEHGDGTVAPEITYNAGNTTFIGSYATYSYGGMQHIINYEGTTKEQRELYDYAMAITANLAKGDAFGLQTVQDDPENAGLVQYYRNIFNEMSQHGYYTEANEVDTLANTKSSYKGKVMKASWFEQQLKEGKLFLKAYSATERDFIQTTLSDDDAIQEVEDERMIALVESEYNQDIAALEKKDQRIDLELKKLDTEHNALQSEYDSVKGVVDKNVEKTFSMFS